MSCFMIDYFSFKDIITFQKILYSCIHMHSCEKVIGIGVLRNLYEQFFIKIDISKIITYSISLLNHSYRLGFQYVSIHNSMQR